MFFFFYFLFFLFTFVIYPTWSICLNSINIGVEVEGFFVLIVVWYILRYVEGRENHYLQVYIHRASTGEGKRER